MLSGDSFKQDGPNPSVHAELRKRQAALEIAAENTWQLQKLNLSHQPQDCL